jgi:hypothetical protein
MRRDDGGGTRPEGFEPSTSASGVHEPTVLEARGFLIVERHSSPSALREAIAAFGLFGRFLRF